MSATVSEFPTLRQGPRPALSIVVPAHQAEATLGKTLASLRRQTLSDIEILVVDDGSTDRTRGIALAAAQADPRVRLFSQQNRGVSAARNTGIRLARADLVGFCDADDLWAPAKAALHVAFMRDRPDVGVSYAGSVTIGDDGSPLGQVQRPAMDPLTVADILCGNPLGNGSTPVISKACLKDVGFFGSALAGRQVCWFDESYSRSEDAELWCRIALTKWKIVGLPLPLTGYRQRARGVSLSSDVEKTIETWARMARALPASVADVSGSGLAHQWRWQARKAVLAGDGPSAARALLLAFAAGGRMREPRKTIETIMGTAALLIGGRAAHRLLLRKMRGGGPPADATWVMDYAAPLRAPEPVQTAQPLASASTTSAST